MNEIISIVGGVAGLSTLILGVLAYFRWKPKHPVEVEAAELDNDKVKWDFQQKVIAEMNAELDRRDEYYRKDADRRDAECERRLKEVEQKMNGKMDGIISEIKDKCINNCFTK